jgi:hypothetical protein
MKKFITSSVIMFLFVFAALAADTSVVSGVVKDSATGQLVSGVEVSIPEEGKVGVENTRQYSLKGARISNTKPAGVYLVGGEKFVSLSCSAKPSFQEGVNRTGRLSKRSAESYSVEFEKTGYNPVSKVLPADQLVEVKLVAVPPVIVPSDSSSANFNISLDSLGTVTIRVEFND